jgi:DNA adenine methylase
MRPENWPRNILRTSQKLQDVRITNWDFEKVLREAPEDSFLFIDPPYFNADQDKFYTHSFSRESHARLAQALERVSSHAKFLLTYDDSEEVRALYRWAASVEQKEWNYTISRTDDQKDKANTRKGARSKGREIFIMNYSPLPPQAVQQELFSLQEVEAA